MNGARTARRAVRAAILAGLITCLGACAGPPRFRIASAPPAMAISGTFDIRKESAKRVSLFGGSYDYEVYLPSTVEEPTATVFVIHGFARDLASMRGWGELLAGRSLRAVVPSLSNSRPWAGGHDRNAADLLDLARLFGGDHVYLGFSAGGLAGFVAALADPAAKAWIGLDPVDSGGLAAAAWTAATAGAARDRLVRASAALLGERTDCNAQGNFRPVLAAAGIAGEIVAGAVHGQFENPYDPFVETFCGATEPPEAAAAQRDRIRARAVELVLAALASAPETGAVPGER